MIDEEVALIRRARPLIPPVDPAMKSRALTRLQAEFDTPQPRIRWLRRRPGRAVGRQRSIVGGWRQLAAAGLVAASAAGAIVAVQTGRTGGGVSTPPSGSGVNTTTTTLELAAVAVARQTIVPRPRGNQWIYTQKTMAFALQPGNAVGPDAMLRNKVKVEEWWRFDGSAMAEAVRGGKLYIKGIEGPGRRPRPGHVDPRYNGGFIGGPGVVNQTPHRLYEKMARLPGEPDALLARVRRDYRDKGEDVTTFGVIAAMLRNNRLIPPEVNAALYRALAKIPKVRVVQNATDYAGRRGIGVIFGNEIARQGEQIANMVILDPRTYRYMGDTVESILDFAVVDKPGQRG